MQELGNLGRKETGEVNESPLPSAHGLTFGSPFASEGAEPRRHDNSRGSFCFLHLPQT